MLIAIWTVTSTVEAQPSDRFPDSEEIQLHGERYQAFNLGGFTELLRIDADLVSSIELIQGLSDQVDEYATTVEGLHTLIDSYENSITILQNERDRLSRELDEETAQRIECQTSPNITEPIAWGLSAIFAITSIVLSVVLGISL